MEVIVAWVPSAENRADELTRVPATWLACAKTLKKAEVPGAASVALVMSSQGPLSSTVIKEAQQEDETMQQAMASQLKDDGRMHDEYRHMQSQLQVADDILMRSVKVPTNEVVVVPVIPGKLEMALMKKTHAMTGHAGYECIYRMLRSRYYFVKMVTKCQSYVSNCNMYLAWPFDIPGTCYPSP